VEDREEDEKRCSKNRCVDARPKPSREVADFDAVSTLVDDDGFHDSVVGGKVKARAVTRDVPSRKRRETKDERRRSRRVDVETI